MIQCFAPDCNHQSERETCKFFRFPSAGSSEFNWWKKLLRRQDRNPSRNSRVCSCHFRAGLKANGPEIFKRNSEKLFPNTETRTPKISNKKKKSKLDDQDDLVVVSEFVEKFNESVDESSLQNGAANDRVHKKC